MLLRVVWLGVLGLALLSAIPGGLLLTHQRPAGTPTPVPPPFAAPLPMPVTSTPAPTFGPFVAITPLPTTPTAGPVVARPMAPRAAGLTDADILADVQQRILAKLPATAASQAQRATLQPYVPVVHRYTPPQWAALSRELPAAAPDALTETLAAVVVPCGCPGSILPHGPPHDLDYLVLVYDPRYSAPVQTLWAPESDLVQAITGNRSKPTATLAPTRNPTRVVAQATADAQPPSAAPRPGLEALR